MCLISSSNSAVPFGEIAPQLARNSPNPNDGVMRVVA
jgi:hypothetical protein